MFVMEEKEPYWPKWMPKSIIPLTSLDDYTRNRMIECEKINSISKSADFRIVTYTRQENNE